MAHDLGVGHPQLRSQLNEQLAQIKAYKTRWPTIIRGLKTRSPQALTQAQKLLSLQRELLLANPLLDFDRLLIVKRSAKKLGLPMNWQGNSDVPSKGYDNEIAVLFPCILDDLYIRNAFPNFEIIFRDIFHFR